MRILLQFILIILSLSTFAEKFQIFQENGRYGLKNSNGEITVPAIHDKLGWSDGSILVIEGVIGFKRNNRWGLISAKNKVLTEHKFYSLTPLNKKYLKASIKGKFSNHLFYGLLNLDGETQVRFNYFSLDQKGELLHVSEFDQFKLRQGVITFDDMNVIPVEYKSISQIDNWLIAEDFNFREDVFLNNTLIQTELDSTRLPDYDQSVKGLICFKDGYAGFLNTQSRLIHNIGFKNFKFEDRKVIPLEFPEWELRDNDGRVFEKKCDSLTYEKGVWIAHMNYGQHIISPFGEKQISKEFDLKNPLVNNMIVRHKRTGVWSLLNEDGNVVFDNPHSIKEVNGFYIAGKNKKQHLHNGFGTRMTKSFLEDIKSGFDNHFIAKRNDYWGVVDFKGNNYITFKYDSISRGKSGFYLAKFLGKWGIMDKHGHWKVNPEYDIIETAGSMMVGHKGLSRMYFHNGKHLFKNTFNVIRVIDDFSIIQDEEGRIGLLNSRGSIIVYPEYDSIKKEKEYFVLKKGVHVRLINSEGEEIVNLDQYYEDLGPINQGYIGAQKNSRWGFLDLKGRLRIANRYEEIEAFNEGMAPVKLRNKWGFINQNEELKVQPYYENVSSFKKGLAIVLLNNRYGLIDTEGKEVISLKWNSVNRTLMGNYLIRNEEGLFGLANERGEFILRPDFDSIKDLDNLVIVKKNGLSGTLQYDGKQQHKMNYADIRIYDRFILLKKFPATYNLN